ncbi:MAG: DUF87 domain-containing protein [Candidatus Dormibacteraeota bacterium]|nr:DUF87 domain-containing protein [Candidatus Dormibacteraeota bacterium]
MVIKTGSVGFMDAAAEDRERWAAAFRAYLDGMGAPLQVVMEFTPGAEPALSGRAGPEAIPVAAERRADDLRFAECLASEPAAQRREVRFVVASGQEAVQSLALAGLGVPSVEIEAWSGAPDEGFGQELPSALQCGGWWHRTFFVDRFPGSELEPGWLLRLVPGGVRLSISWHAERLPNAWVVGHLQRQIVNMRATRLGGGVAGGDPHLHGALPATETLQQQLIAGRESAFYVSLYLTVTASTRERLTADAQQVDAAARAALCRLLPCDFRHLDGRLCTLPLGRDPLHRRRMLHTSALTTLFPWFDAELQDRPGGLVLGRSRATGRPVLVDPFDDRRYANANVGVFGHSGAGKTYLLSLLTMGALGAGAQVFVIDPEHEYGALARHLGGLEVRLALGSGHSLNVLDMRGGATDEAVIGPVAADTVDLCATICGGLDESEGAHVEAAVRETLLTESEPVLGDVALRLDPASRVATILGRWVRGSLGEIFSRPTNIDLEAPIVVFGMRELRAEMVAPVHYLLAEALWARIKQRDRRRLLVVDEMGLLFEDPTIRRFVVALARRIRKYDGSLVFATQNPGDLLSSEPGRVVATNPAIHLFGAQRPGEAAALQSVFKLSDRQRTGLETARRGEFLLSAGADRLPLQVVAPPWQAHAMRLAREPP